ncbi:type IV secretion system DNA-binding domain-containing protein [Patescibacteria group bacterium]|nr:type IV secretion system DNA-binding domain-containing protein [Patescibacteria group bacterium]
MLWEVVIFLVVIGAIGVVLLVVSSAGHKTKITNRAKSAIGRKLFLITLPKHLSEESKSKSFKELVAPAEVLLRNLNSIKDTIGNDHITLEILASKGLIGFYASVPAKIASLLEKQITAQYSDALVEEVDDPNIFPEKCATAAIQLTLKKEQAYPILTYKEFETDTLNALTNALSKLNSDTEGGGIQFVLRPANDRWQKRGQTIASAMKSGKFSDDSLAQGVMKGLGGLLIPSLVEGKAEDKAKTEIKQLTPSQEKILQLIAEKASKPGFEMVTRVVTAGPTIEEAKINLNNILSSFNQYTSDTNRFTIEKLPEAEVLKQFIFRLFSLGKPDIFSTEEVTTLWHLPTPRLETPNIMWLRAKRLPAPNNLPKEGMVLGKNIYRGVENIVKIQEDDRRRHIYCIGKTGTGKTTWMQNLAYQDIIAGRGVCVVDPHGDMTDWLLQRIPKDRIDDVIYFYPPDLDRPMGLNMLEAKTPNQKQEAVSQLISIFYKLFDPTGTSQMIGPMFEHYMRNAMLALMADDEAGATLVEIPRMFTDAEFRKQKLAKVTDPVIKQFWLQEYAQSQRGQQSADMLSYVISKIGRFISNDMMRNIVGQTKSSFDIRTIMDEGKILLINLAKGLTGDLNSNLLGFILVSKIQMAALSRADMPESERKDFYLYIDEFQNVTTDSIATILSEARKYKLNLTMAHQFVTQLDEKIREAVLGNAGTMVSFTIGPSDTEIIGKQFEPEVSENDLINIENRNAYIKLLIDGAVSKPFNLIALPPMGEPRPKVAEALRKLSRLKFGRDKRIVETEISYRSQLLRQNGDDNLSSPRPENMR